MTPMTETKTRLLPPEFADLEPFAATWCLATEHERFERRLATPMDEMQASTTPSRRVTKKRCPTVTSSRSTTCPRTR